MDYLACPRPGHGDLNGSIKYLGSIRGILERASARETTARIGAGGLAKQLLAHIGIEVFAYVAAIAGVIHYYMQVKAEVRQPLVFAAVLGLLLGYRLLPNRLQPKPGPTGTPAPAPNRGGSTP